MASPGTYVLDQLKVLLSKEVLNTVQMYFELKIVNVESTNLYRFLQDRVHELFHYFVQQIPCCNTQSPCALTKKQRTLTKEQFSLLYKNDSAIQPIHETKNKERIVQHCICPLIPNNAIEVIDLDLTLINCLIKTCRMTPAGHPQWLKDIIEVRNCLSHVGDDSSVKDKQVHNWWIKLENAALNIAGTIGVTYKKMVERRISEIRTSQSQLVELMKDLKKRADDFEQMIVNALQNIDVRVGDIPFHVTGTELVKEKPHISIAAPVSVPDTGTQKCIVVWKFSNPGNWNLEKMKEKLELLKRIGDFDIDFVYQGSLVIHTVADITILSDERRFKDSIEEFLFLFVQLLVIQESTAASMDVAFSIWIPEFDAANQGDVPSHVAATEFVKEKPQPSIASPVALPDTGDIPFHVTATECVKEKPQTSINAQVPIPEKGLPKEIQYMSDEDSESFRSLLETGFYKSYVGKIMTVGHEAVGKTTITEVLRGKKPSNTRMATEGIDIHTYQAAVDIEEKLWVKRELKPYDVAYRNLMMSSSSTKTDIENIDMNIDIRDDSNLIAEDLKENDESYNAISMSAFNEENPDTLHMYDTKRSIKDRLKDLLRPKVEITAKTLHTNSLKFGRRILVSKALVPVNMWDFAGHAAFYSTHQTFLTYRGIYIIPINVSIEFDDAIETESFIPGRHGKPTSREFTFFWICSILSYSKCGVEGFPKIIPVLTHKDKVSPEHLEARVNYFYKEIKTTFRHTPWMKHLVLGKQICLNAIDNNDPDYEILQNVLVDCLCSQPSWGEQLPKAWIPLQLAINVNRDNGRKIIAISELLKENENNPVKVLTQNELMVFLKILHAQGDILFFPLAGIRDYVIISPSYFVDALKSLVTHTRFVTGIRRKVLQSLNETGQLQRRELYNIWKNKNEFWKHREHLFAVMMHLNIISIPRKYTSSGTLVYSDFLYVPSLINKVDDTSYATRPNLHSKVMAISFKFQNIITPAVGHRLIASCTDMFEVRKYENKSMLFSGMVVLAVKKSLDLVVILRRDRIDVYLVHDVAISHIVQNTAVGLFECVTDILSTISDSFKKLSSEDKKEKHIRPFSMEYPCFNMESPCYNTTRATWNCRHGHKMDDAYFSKWTVDRQRATCVPLCQGTNKNDFIHKPSELQLANLCLESSWTDIYQVMMHLGMRVTDLKAIEEDHGRGYKAMFLCLRHWNRKFDGKIGNLHKALKDSERDVHLLCKMNRDRPLGPLPDYLKHKTEPSDKDLDLIAAEVIEESILLAVQLGQDAKDWLQMKADNYKIININREILRRWRQEKTTKTRKMEDIAQALYNVGIHISSILTDEFAMPHELEPTDV